MRVGITSRQVINAARNALVGASSLGLLIGGLNARSVVAAELRCKQGESLVTRQATFNVEGVDRPAEIKYCERTGTVSSSQGNLTLNDFQNIHNMSSVGGSRARALLIQLARQLRNTPNPKIPGQNLLTGQAGQTAKVNYTLADGRTLTLTLSIKDIPGTNNAQYAFGAVKLGNRTIIDGNTLTAPKSETKK